MSDRRDEAGSESALRELAVLYAELEAELARIAPRCELSGRCCDFPRSGLTLFSTDLELDLLERRTPPPDAAAVGGEDDRLCPHWRGGLCQAREGRPLGCRLYFCDERKALALEELSVRFHDRLKRLHDRAGIAYRYGPFVPRVRERRTARIAALTGAVGSP